MTFANWPPVELETGLSGTQQILLCRSDSPGIRIIQLKFSYGTLGQKIWQCQIWICFSQKKNIWPHKYKFVNFLPIIFILEFRLYGLITKISYIIGIHVL